MQIYSGQYIDFCPLRAFFKLNLYFKRPITCTKPSTGETETHFNRQGIKVFGKNIKGNV